jgi:hypothetical protein
MEPHKSVACAVSDSCVVVFAERLLLALATLEAASGATEIAASATAPSSRRIFRLAFEGRALLI